MFFENDYTYLNDRKFLEELQELKVKEQYLKVELLDFSTERVVQEIQGRCVTGSLSIDGNSSVRRTCSFSIIPDVETYSITDIDNLISINKKFKLYVGYKNTLNHYKEYGDIIWFPQGLFVVCTASINNSLSGGTINISAKDKMCLLNGEVGGTLTAPVVLHESYIRNTDDEGRESTTVKKTLIYNIIRESVTELGGVDPSRVIINDVPLKIKKVLRYIGKDPIYINSDGSFVDKDDPNAIAIEPDDLAGYSYVDFTYPGELVKNAGDTVVSILDSIKNLLGNFEYYFDTQGNFIFQEIKNYLNKSYTGITHLNGEDYMVDFSQKESQFSFKNSDIIVSYSNSPNYQNIKNDFVVWGKKKAESGATIPIRYHLAIDDIPEVPKEYGNIPWQVYLYKYGKEAQGLARDPGYYYRELANEIPDIYNLETNEWKQKDEDSMSMKYFLDFIDSKSELGKYSVNTIGRRSVVVSDNDVTLLYRPPNLDFIILDNSNKEDMSIIPQLNAIGQSFIQVTPEQRKLYSNAGVGKDAFSVIRDLIFKHTTYNENISITAMPIYYMEPNIKIEVEDNRSNIYGEYIIKNITLPLTHEGTMSFSAVRATTRL